MPPSPQRPTMSMRSMPKSKNSSDFPWYQPSTQNQRLRTLLGSTSKEYGWKYKMSDFSFKGGLKGFLDKLYSKRYKEFGKGISVMLS